MDEMTAIFIRQMITQAPGIIILAWVVVQQRKSIASAHETIERLAMLCLGCQSEEVANLLPPAD